MTHSDNPAPQEPENPQIPFQGWQEVWIPLDTFWGPRPVQGIVTGAEWDDQRQTPEYTILINDGWREGERTLNEDVFLTEEDAVKYTLNTINTLIPSLENQRQYLVRRLATIPKEKGDPTP